MTVPVAQINEHIAWIDNGLLETDGFGATYVVRGDQIALIETGTSPTAPATLAGLEQLGIAPEEVQHILLTHIHMDHVGGAGPLVQALPNAAVYINSMTAEHLIDPTRLLRSVERAVGEMWPLYGTIVPIPAERIKPAEDLRLDLGQNIVIEAIATPGHSPDHLAFWDALSQTLWAGDAIGIVMSTHQVACAVTPPPTFDLIEQYATFDRLRQLPIQTLLPSHFGHAAGDPRSVLDQMEELVRKLEVDVRSGLETGEMPVEHILARVMAPADARHAGVKRVLHGTTVMSIHGMRRYLEKHGYVG